MQGDGLPRKARPRPIPGGGRTNGNAPRRASPAGGRAGGGGPRGMALRAPAGQETPPGSERGHPGPGPTPAGQRAARAGAVSPAPRVPRAAPPPHPNPCAPLPHPSTPSSAVLQKAGRGPQRGPCLWPRGPTRGHTQPFVYGRGCAFGSTDEPPSSQSSLSAASTEPRVPRAPPQSGWADAAGEGRRGQRGEIQEAGGDSGRGPPALFPRERPGLSCPGKGQV